MLAIQPFQVMFDLSPYSGGILRISYGNYMQLTKSISVIPQHGKSEVVLQFIMIYVS